MAISFQIPDKIQQEIAMLKQVSEGVIRPLSREMDENEHQRPWPYINLAWMTQRETVRKTLERLKGEGKPKREGPGTANLRLICMVEQLSWGDVGIYLCTPGPMLAGFAIEAAGTKEQKFKFLQRYVDSDTPIFGAMAMTEPGAGSDTANIQTTAKYDPETNEFILNGEKIFCTNGKLAFDESNGLIVVWATLDRSAGRAGMRAFVVEAGTPGVKVTKTEIKHGIRASDTVAIVLDNARVPADHILGDPEIKKPGEGGAFKEAMATFDASRPMVAASTLGVARAAIDYLKEQLAAEGIEIPYGKPERELTALQRDVIEMEAQWKAAWLLTLRSTSMLDHGQRNSLEASMAKAKAGKVATQITQKVVELLGPLGYSRESLAEKFMRDGKIGDLYEGTGQINTLIVARRILGYGSKELS